MLFTVQRDTSRKDTCVTRFSTTPSASLWGTRGPLDLDLQCSLLFLVFFSETKVGGSLFWILLEPTVGFSPARGEVPRGTGT